MESIKCGYITIFHYMSHVHAGYDNELLLKTTKYEWNSNTKVGSWGNNIAACMHAWPNFDNSNHACNNWFWARWRHNPAAFNFNPPINLFWISFLMHDLNLSQHWTITQIKSRVRALLQCRVYFWYFHLHMRACPCKLS